MSAINHKVNAQKALLSVHEETAPEWSTVWATEAQAHATLYLAEQQRIANLIALGLGTSSKEIREGLGLMTATNEYGYTRAEIAEDAYEPNDPRAFDVADAEEHLEVCS